MEQRAPDNRKGKDISHSPSSSGSNSMNSNISSESLNKLRANFHCFTRENNVGTKLSFNRCLEILLIKGGLPNTILKFDSGDLSLINSILTSVFKSFA